MIRVLLADDQVLVRAGFRAILNSAEDITVVAEAGDGAEAIRQTECHHPDVVLMDIRMPGTDGLAATGVIRQASAAAARNTAIPDTAAPDTTAPDTTAPDTTAPDTTAPDTAAPDTAAPDTKVIILTTYESDDYLYAALRAGASGFLLKDTEPTELLHAVRVVIAGDALLSPSVTRRLVADLASRPAPASRSAPAALATLTHREREIVVLVAEGLSNHDIAQRLFISPHTAKTHVNRAMTKLDVRDRAQLVIIAYESGLVGLGHPERLRLPLRAGSGDGDHRIHRS